MEKGGRTAMRVSALILLTLAVVTPAAWSATEERAPLTGVTAVRLANYGAPSVLINERHQVRTLVDELLAARRLPWRRGDTGLSCYSTVMLLIGEKKMVAMFRVAGDHLVEQPLEKGQSSFSLILGDTDLPGLRKLLAEITPPRCRVPTRP